MNNIYFYLSLLGISFTGITIYKGYHYGKRRLQEYVMSKVLEELNQRMEKQEQDEMFKVMHTHSAVVKVTSAGKTHSIYLPYSRKRIIPMLKKRVYLIKEGEKIELNQKPGIPYLVSASNLGGSSIIVEDIDSNSEIIFSANEIPNILA